MECDETFYKNEKPQKKKKEAEIGYVVFVICACVYQFCSNHPIGPNPPTKSPQMSAYLQKKFLKNKRHTQLELGTTLNSSSHIQIAQSEFSELTRSSQQTATLGTSAGLAKSLRKGM